jgi:hypothetical protein
MLAEGVQLRRIIYASEVYSVLQFQVESIFQRFLSPRRGIMSWPKELAVSPNSHAPALLNAHLFNNREV